MMNPYRMNYFFLGLWNNIGASIFTPANYLMGPVFAPNLKFHDNKSLQVPPFFGTMLN